MAAAAAAALAAGGTIYGAKESKDQAGEAMDAQAQQNAENRQFIKEQASKARDDIMPLFKAAAENRQAGAESAMDVLKAATKGSIGATRGGFIRAQDTLQAGLDPQMAAILGGDIDTSGLKTARLGPATANNLISSASMPQLQNPGELLSGTYGDGAGFNIDPGKTTNREIVAQAFDNGTITGRDYEALQESFKAQPEIASQGNWGAAPDAGHLINQIGDETAPAYRRTLEKLFQAALGG